MIPSPAGTACGSSNPPAQTPELTTINRILRRLFVLPPAK